MNRKKMLLFNQTLVSDTFTRANSDTTLGKSETGQTWNTITGTAGISNNAAVAKVAGANASYINSLASNVRLTVTVSSGERAFGPNDVVGFSIRGDGSDNNRIRLFIGGDIQLRKVIGGSSTTLATYAFTWGAGVTKTIKMKAEGNNFTVYLNDVEIIATTDDNVLKSGYTHAGILQFSNTVAPVSIIDDFKVEAI